MFLKILQISEENTCVADPQTCNFIKKRLQYKCFPVNFLRIPFSTEQLQWLLFKIRNSNKLWISIKHVSATSLTHNQSLHKICENTGQWQPIFSHILCSESLMTCNSHNDKLIWKCSHLPKLVPIEQTNSLV